MPPIKHLIFLTALLVSGYAQAQRVCTEIGCLSGLVISISTNYSWQPGNYEFDFLIDGRTLKCSGTLPLESCERRSVTCSEDGIIITESGCALASEGHAFGDIMLSSEPRYISVKISRNGQEIASAGWTPNYQIFRPNGPSCLPICRQSTVKLDLW